MNYINDCYNITSPLNLLKVISIDIINKKVILKIE